MPKTIDGHGMRLLAELIQSAAPGLGFALITFPLNSDSKQLINYISNGQREDMITALKGLLEKWESGTDFMTPENN